MVFLGIDVGTTSLKAAAFDENGRRLALAVRDYTLDTDAASGFIEFPADEYIRICKDAVEEICRACPKLDAISVDTQGETLILADREGRALCPAVVWLDNRAQAQADKIKARFGNKYVYEVTGQPEISPGWPAAKLMWFRENRPEIWEKTEKVFLLEDWILYRLTGEFVTEGTIQSSSLYFDIRTGEWWEEMLDYIGLEKSKLPRLTEGGTRVGAWRGTAVVSGALDQIAGSLGAGVTDTARVSEMTGTIMAICVLTDKIPPYNPDSIIPCHYHTKRGKYCLILWSSTAGMALKWFRNNFAPGQSFAQLDEAAAKIPPGSEGLVMLPYMCGSTMPAFNPDAKAVFSGFTLAHTGAHFARAIMESVAYLLKSDLDYLGIKNCEIRIMGGGAQSDLWPQIKADVTGERLVTLTESETACLGTAMLAAYGVGAFDDIDAAVERAVLTDRVFTPSGADYTAAYEEFRRLDGLLNTK